MDDQRRGGPADAAEVMVAHQDPFPAPAEAAAGAPAAVVAGLAQPAAVELGRSAGAAQRDLRISVLSPGTSLRRVRARPEVHQL